MIITDARVIVTSPGRNFTTLKIVTDEGLTGVGDATLNGRELAVAAYLTEHVVPLLIGRDAGRIEDTWQYLYKGAYWRRGPVTMTAISAVDTALWDIKGKQAGLPVHQLLGGRSRDGVTVYGHANGTDTDSLLTEVDRLIREGYRAVRVQSGVPGLEKVYGVSDRDVYEPADSAVPTETVWSTEAYLDHLPGVVARVREEFGPGVKLLHDVHHRLTPIEAARLGKALEPYALTWLEDPVPAELQSGYRIIRRHTTTPIAVGEVFNTIWDCADLIREQLIDYIRCSVVHAGGISHLRRIHDLAALHHVRTGAHGATDMSPVCMAASLQLGISAPNFGLQEHMPHTAETDAVFPHAYRYADGYLHPGDEPGLGVDIDEDLAARYPYKAASLPVNRLADGTLHSW
ncbi:D-mannonate dehydratase ManD [Pseudonocardia lacus]|uniref:D-mannonate dehydratase ManD n=1 Tax=Pseudonocardia lacus TaxID=2835865 RepID=UPI001BDD3B2B|nr:D-mannonate dehydratase ManD [Pseudonocardia lacus]